MNVTINSSTQARSETTPSPLPTLPPRVGEGKGGGLLPLPVPQPELDEVLRAIRADCLLAPDEYLEEVRVPFGGE